MARPEISVLMGVYYHRSDTALLERSVESILAQSVTDFEFLICDDGSAPETKRLLERYADQDSRICLVRTGGKISLPQKLNACLEMATGKFIARMDDDDYSCPERFRVQLQAMEDHPEIDFIGCNVALCRGMEAFAWKEFPEFPTVKDFFMTQPYVHPALFFRREVLDAVGGYCEEKYCDHCEDYDLLLRLYARGYRGMNLQRILLHYTAPNLKGNRTMRHRWNEVVTRWRRFKQLQVLPQALPFVVKPIVVGLLPGFVLRRLKERNYSVQQSVCGGE